MSLDPPMAVIGWRDEQAKGRVAADFASAASLSRRPGFPAAVSERSEFSGRPAGAAAARGPRRGASDEAAARFLACGASTRRRFY